MPVRACVFGLAATLLCPALALARQARPDGPLLEAGVDVGLRDVEHYYGSEGLVSPRLTINFDRSTALDLGGDAVVAHTGPAYPVFDYRVTTHLVYVSFRRTLYQAGPLSAAATIGGGGVFTKTECRPIEYCGPVNTSREVDPSLQIGFALGEQIGSRLKLRQDFRIGLWSNPGAPAFSVGVSVPFGQYARAARSPSLPRAGLPIRTGERVWISTTDGREATGFVGALTDTSVEVQDRSRQVAVRVSDIDTIQVPDGIGDGIRRGAIAGAIGMGSAVGMVGGLLCEYCGPVRIIGEAVAGAGFGAVVGGLGGALIDSLHEGRQTVFSARSKPTVAVAPIVGRSTNAVVAAVSW